MWENSDSRVHEVLVEVLAHDQQGAHADRADRRRWLPTVGVLGDRSDGEEGRVEADALERGADTTRLAERQQRHVAAAQQPIDGRRAHASDHEDRVELTGLDRRDRVAERHVARLQALAGDPEVTQDRVGDRGRAAALGTDADALAEQVVRRDDVGVAAHDNL